MSPRLKSRSLALRKSVIRIALGVLMGATLVMAMFEKHFIYYPSGETGVTPQSAGLPFEDVFLEVEPGVKVHAWFIKAGKEPGVGTILFSHGNAGNIADRVDRVLSLRPLDVDFLLYDYRGYGKSTGEPDEEGTYRDGRAAYDYLVQQRGLDPGRIVLMGESLGCAVSVQLALERKAAGLILEAPFASIALMASSVYPFLPLRPFIRTRYDNLKKMPHLKMPLLVLQGTKDEVIPPVQGRMLFDAAPEPKRHVAIEGAHHNDVYLVGGRSYLDSLSDFIRRVTKDRSLIPSHPLIEPSSHEPLSSDLRPGRRLPDPTRRVSRPAFAYGLGRARTRRVGSRRRLGRAGGSCPSHVQRRWAGSGDDLC